MRGLFFSIALLSALLAGGFTSAFAQEGYNDYRLDSVVVVTSRAGKSTPVTYTMVDKAQLRSANPIESLPMSLSLLPSVGVYSEGGTGLGNSAMTIRGSKGSQINVTLNGITLNDSESQEVFWVNIPALTGIISSVQVQRGLGTSANGAGAFGASINMSTSSVSGRPSASVEMSYGSWNTALGSVSASTGLLRSGLYFNLAYSKGYTDGYIRNAYVNSQSVFAVLGWLRGDNSLSLSYLMGDQSSGITWDGISREQYKKDRRYNEAGEYWDEDGKVHYYDNQTDNYAQHHLQLNYTRHFSAPLVWTTTLNYTRGDGYDEYYADKKASYFAFGNEFLPGVKRSDSIYRKKMGNDYWVVSSDLCYSTPVLDITGGINLSTYSGDHFGRLLWVKALGDDYDYDSFNKRDGWYMNHSRKKEFSAFVRGEWKVTDKVTTYADLQLRGISLKMEGPDSDHYTMGTLLDGKRHWLFFNPRAGITYTPAKGHKAYASVAYGNREPGRSDIKENIKGGEGISHESMVDVELGYEYSSPTLTLGADIYFMEYDNMLLETGMLSSSGYAIKQNVPDSYRRGIELMWAYAPSRVLKVEGNATFSTNKIKDYTAYLGIYDENWEYTGRVLPVDYGTTRMLFSPSFQGMMQLTLTPWKGTSSPLSSTRFTVNGKYTGKQYIDNTERKEMEIPGYFVANLVISHEFKLGRGGITLSGYLNNFLNNKYYAYGWKWEDYLEASGETEGGVGIYPQPITNFMFKIAYRF